MHEPDPYAPQPLARWFRPAAVAAAAWMALGCVIYLLDVTADPLKLTLDQRLLQDATPPWYWAAYGTATWIGLVGAILLLLRRKLAVPLLLISLLAVAVMLSAFFIVPELRNQVSSDQLLVPIIVLALGWTIFWFARHSQRRGWLR